VRGQGQAGGALGDLKKHAIVGFEQTGPDVKLARGRTKVHDIEDLPIRGLVASPQVDSQRAIKHRRPTDIDLVIKTSSGASSGTANFDQQGATGILGVIPRNGLHTW